VKLKPHALADRRQLEQHLPISQSLFDRMKQAAEAKTGDLQIAYSELVRLSLKHACIALLLGRGDDEAVKHFHQAVEYGMGLLDAPSGKGPRIYEVEVNVSERGAELAALHEKKPHPGHHPLSVGDFGEVLFATIAFGDRNQRAKVASYPEEKYRSPGIVAPESLFQHLRGLKAWLRGEEGLSKREVETALQATKGGKGWMAAFLAMATRDQAAFEKYLEERLKAHKRQYQQTGDPLGYICLDGLALCRLAVEQGLQVEEWPYLPVRLLPNYHPPIH